MRLVAPAYTLDDAYAAAVQKVFVDLYDKGLIYRGRRMINWDPRRKLPFPTRR
jgi:Valyl-tRNA synthetase